MFHNLEKITCILYYKSQVEVSGKIYCDLNVQYASSFHDVIGVSSEQAFFRRVCGWNTGKALEEWRHDGGRVLVTVFHKPEVRSLKPLETKKARGSKILTAGQNQSIWR